VEPKPIDRRNGGRQVGRAAPAEPWSASRILAVLVLLPAVPLLLMSVLALVTFYSAPTRFNALLVRLPGDELIRTALIFAPATLVAVVVMAVLYANDAPRREAAEGTRPSARRRGLRARRRGGLARSSLWVTLPALMFVAAAQLLAFVAPARVDQILEALPATTLLTRLFGMSPIVVAAVVGLGLVFGFVPGAEAPAAGLRTWTTPRIARLGALLTLVPALGLLLLSVAGLGMILASPDRLAWLADKLPAETLLRLGLAFSPAMLLGLVLLAALYLTVPPRTSEVQPLETDPSPGGGFRSGLALGVLVAGLGFTVLAGMAVLVAVVFVLVLR
jgi:hypothetical protein